MLRILKINIIISAVLISLITGCSRDPRSEYKYIDIQSDFTMHPEYGIDWIYANMMLNSPDSSRAFAYSFILTNHNDNLTYIYDINESQTHYVDTEGKVKSFADKWYFNSKYSQDSIILTDDMSVLYKHISDSFQCSLKLTATRHPVLAADSGRMIMWDSLMYYYSMPRMSVKGIIETPHYKGPVEGTAWIDRQWGDFVLGYESYTWFSIYLDNDTDIMVYKLNTTRQARMFIFKKDIFKYAEPEGAGITEKAYVIPVSQIKKDETLIPFGWRIFDSSKNTELLVIPEYDYHNMWGDSIKNTYQGICSVEGIYNGEYVRGRAYMEFNGAEYYKTQRLKLYDEKMFRSDIKLMRELLRKKAAGNSD